MVRADESTMLTSNEIKAKAYIIGKQLAQIDWYNLTAEQARQWCTDKALLCDTCDAHEAEIIAHLAMLYVIS